MSTQPPAALLRELGELLPSGALSTDESDLAAYGRDWTKAYAPAPVAVVRPSSTDEIARVVGLCRAHKQPMVPSGGRTGLAGGAVAARGELVVSLERMNRIDPVDVTGLTLRVDAGAVTEQVHQHCAVHGLTWPVDLASKGSSQVGGNLATNAGGVKVIRYGHARNWVLGLVVVTAAGDVLELGGAVEKDNTGVDLRQLFIGSEGTLGFITEATLKLTRLPAHLAVALFAVDGIDAGLRLFESARREPFQLQAYELFTEPCMARFRAHRGFGPPFARPAAAYILVEAEAPDRAGFEHWAHGALAAAGVVDGVIAQTPAQGRELWRLREGISEALGATGLPHKNDVALPVRALGAFCRELEAVFAASYPGWEICLFGHVGDGNLHINVMKPDALAREEFFRQTGAADHAVFELVQRNDGSISAEHGIGLVKKDYLVYSRSPAEIRLMRQLKAMMDPDNLLNPGKILD